MNQDDAIKELLFYSPGNVYFKNSQGRYLACNYNQLRLVGFKSLPEIVNKTDYDLYPVSIADKLTAIDSDIMKKGIETTFEEEGVDAQGNPAIYMTKKIPIFDKNNNLKGLIGTSFDITKEKQAEIAKKDFLSNMQHDLRTPFSGINGIADMLYQKEEDINKRELLGLIVISCQQWETIHHSIFDALAIEQQPVRLESFSLSDEVATIELMMAATLRIKNLGFSNNTPAPELLGLINTDRLKVQLILLSLISNAIQFTEQGTITVIIERKNKTFVVKIVDTGMGIADDKLNYIFERFTKLSRSNQYGSNFKGMGLGLYISRYYAESLKGQITVTSTVGYGSIFTLTLPESI